MKILSDDEILKIYKDHNWIIFEPDLSRAKAVAREAEDRMLEQVVEKVEEQIWSSSYITPTNKIKVLFGIKQALNNTGRS